MTAALTPAPTAAPASLLPIRAARHLVDGITEYLATNFSLADWVTAERLGRFLLDPDNGMFRGPYVRVRLPYKPAEHWEGLLEWLPKDFVPYEHQEKAFRRLASMKDGEPRRPEPTLVVTGTGSGKTESFLYPILDHCRREQQAGRQGIKALILYPMNALANDQAARLTKLLLEDPALSGIRAGIYTGEATGNRMKVSEKGLINDREQMRMLPPDILLTNYKMLDQLLLRDEDAPLWEKSAESLQYIALDEFHTYDAAQGTDVALLLRRLGLRLKKHQASGFLTEEERQRPLGRITPVATSATLGSDEKAEQEMLNFARMIFGETLDPTAIILETTQGLVEWQDELLGYLKQEQRISGIPNRFLVQEINRDIDEALRSGDKDYAHVVHEVMCEKLFQLLPGVDDIDEVVAAAVGNELVVQILLAKNQPTLLGDHAFSTANIRGVNAEGETPALLNQVLPPEVTRLPGGAAAEFLGHVLNEIAYLRAQFGAKHGWHGKKFPGVETHMWVREVSRLDRRVGAYRDDETPMFRWTSDGYAPSRGADEETSEKWLPACYCRSCGCSGWMTAAKPGCDELEESSSKIRSLSVSHKRQLRPLIHITQEPAADRGADRGARGGKADAGEQSRSRLDLETMTLKPWKDSGESSEDESSSESAGIFVPVLTYPSGVEEEFAAAERCPACDSSNSIRFLGSRVATLLSVGLSNLFGMGDLDNAEKKSLVFVDSVQDAAHRAGFVQAKARTFAIRTRIQQAVADKHAGLDELAERLIRAAETDAAGARARFELLPDWAIDNTRLRNFWASDVASRPYAAAASSVQKVLEFNLVREFGYRAHLSRSLATTGAVTVGVHVTDAELREALEKLTLPEQLNAEGTISSTSLAWARGVLERMRLEGGIYTSLLAAYLQEDAKTYMLNRPEAHAQGLPKFAPGDVPRFPRKGKELSGKDTKQKSSSFKYGYNSLGSQQGWYARWTAKMLHVPTKTAAELVVALFDTLAKQDVLLEVKTSSKATMYALPASRVRIDSETEPKILACSACSNRLAVDSTGRELLSGEACILLKCHGHLEIVENPDNYYRALYHSKSTRTVVAKEHTSLLESKERIEIEDVFKQPLEQQPADSPNVLVATPTLEMGIDIGDLSMVVLASLPNTVASYVQRVGRAGRLTGNSLALTFVKSRHKALARWVDPLNTIAGAVQAPAVFLSAREILQRQFVAYVIDSIDFHAAGVDVRALGGVFDLRNASVVGEVIQRIQSGVTDLLDEFVATVREYIDDRSDTVVADLREWVDNGCVPQLEAAARQWQAAHDELQKRANELDVVVAELKAKADSPAVDDVILKQYRRAKAARSVLSKQRRDFNEQHWVSVLEQYGILPNFTLLDDTVEFNLKISRQILTQHDGSEQKFEDEARTYTRGAASALYEFAPGAKFYAQGLAATIDTVDVGDNGSKVEIWRVCPSCAYSEVYPDCHDVKDVPSAGACRECGDAAFGSTDEKYGNVIPVVTLRKVSATIDAENSSIDSAREEREDNRYERVLTIDVPKGGYGKEWYLQNTGFGVQNLSSVEMRWLNLGRPVGVEKKWLTGREVEALNFSLCRHCGHSTGKPGEDSWKNHAPWCDQRTAVKEDTVAVALGRRLMTQGVLMHIPPDVIALDKSSLPSFIAALNFGFKQYLGGNPDHLAAEMVKRSSGTGGTQDMVLLYDKIPGGSGYLSQFVSPGEMHGLLCTVHEELSTCDCASTSAKSCQQCLLPFAPPQSSDTVSREAALWVVEKLLLDNTHPEPHKAGGYATQNGQTFSPNDWSMVDKKPDLTDRSHLEAEFIRCLRTAFGNSAMRVEVAEETRNGYVRWTINFGESGPKWKMTEQKDLQGSYGTIPDFYFERIDAQSKSIAVYTDGLAYHATKTNNRVKDDFKRRSRLHKDGILPWSLTAEDLQNFTMSGQMSSPAPRWLNQEYGFREALKEILNISAGMYDVLLDDPMTQLLKILRKPEASWDKIAESMKWHLKSSEKQQRQAFHDAVSFQGLEANCHELRLTITDGTPDEEAWREFLRAANLLYLGNGNKIVVNDEHTRDYGSSCDAVHPVEPVVVDVPKTSPDTPAQPAVSAAWQRVLDEYENEPDVIRALQILIDVGAVAPLEENIGAESAGLLTVVSWPQHKIVLAFPGEAVEIEAGVGQEWTVLDLAGLTREEIPSRLC